MAVALIGVFCLLPIPLTFLAGAVIGFWAAMLREDVSGILTSWAPTAVEGGMVVPCASVCQILRLVYRTPVERSPEVTTQT